MRRLRACFSRRKWGTMKGSESIFILPAINGGMVTFHNPQTGEFRNFFIEGDRQGGVILELKTGESSVYNFDPDAGDRVCV